MKQKHIQQAQIHVAKALQSLSNLNFPEIKTSLQKALQGLNKANQKQNQIKQIEPNKNEVKVAVSPEATTWSLNMIEKMLEEERKKLTEKEVETDIEMLSD